jgi:hypothetical protein
MNRIHAFCKNEEFIKEKIQDAATYAAIQELTSPDKVKEVYITIMDQIFPIIGSIIYPDPSLVSNFEQPFEAIKQYMLSMLDADVKEGLHHYELIENTNHVLRFNVTHCAWFEIKKELGIPEATFQDCYADEASLPSILDQVGIEFSRKKTIAEGFPYCDFCFKKIKK